MRSLRIALISLPFILAAIGIGVSAVSVSSVEATSGRSTESAFVVTPSTSSSTAPIPSGKSGLYSVTESGVDKLYFLRSTGGSLPLGGGAGHSRRTTENSALYQAITVTPHDAGEATEQPDQLISTIGGSCSGGLTAECMETYQMTANASNHNGQYAAWVINGAVESASGTVAAVGSSAAVGTGIAPTYSTAASGSTSADKWRIKPVNIGSGKWGWQLQVFSRDGGAGNPGPVYFNAEETTLP